MNIDNLVIETDRIRRIPEMPIHTSLNDAILGRYKPIFLLTALLVLWFIGPKGVNLLDETAGSIDQGIWLLILLSIICFLIVTGLCWWLVNHTWKRLGLPAIHSIATQYKTLNPWQQLHLFLASFALVLVAALATMIAII